jgi:hypothetical protein
LQARSHVDEHFIAYHVAVGVVDLLEVVKIHEQEDCTAAQPRFKTLEKKASIPKARQRIGQARLRQLRVEIFELGGTLAELLRPLRHLDFELPPVRVLPSSPPATLPLRQRNGEEEETRVRQIRPPASPRGRLDADCQGQAIGVPHALATGTLHPQDVASSIEVRVCDSAFRADVNPVLVESLEFISKLIAARRSVVQSCELEGDDRVPIPEIQSADTVQCSSKWDRLVQLQERRQDDGRHELSGLDVSRVENVEALSASEIQRAVGVTVMCSHVELRALEAVLGTVSRESLPGRVKTEQAIVGAEPEGSFSVRLDTVDDVIREAVVFSEPGEPKPRVVQIETGQATPMHANPKRSLWIRVKRPHGVH